MANPHPTTSPANFAELTTYKLRSWNELYSVQTKRYYHIPEGAGIRSVEIAADLRVACRCGAYQRNLSRGLGPCEHIAEALDYLDSVGFRRLPTWAAARS